MTGESQRIPDSPADPTVYTTEAISRAEKAQRDYFNAQLDVLRERLRGIDKATELLNETVNRTPTDIQKEIAHLRELCEEKFESVALQFKERDTRSERESRDNKVAVDAAFAAQKEAATKQDEANQKAIDKSEKATNVAIDKLAELVKTTTDALDGRINDLKSRADSSESSRLGSRERISDSRQNLTGTYQLIGIIVAVVTLVGILAAAGVFNSPN